MPSVGEILKRARQQQGLDLSAVAARTKINAKYLEAIESDNRKLLPSGFFYKSFVDQYAKSLALDTREIDAEIDRLLSADEPLPLPGFESVVARNVPPIKSPRHFAALRSLASTISLVLVIAGCSGVYTLWHAARSSFSVKGALDNVRAWAKPAAVHAAPFQVAGVRLSKTYGTNCRASRESDGKSQRRPRGLPHNVYRRQSLYTPQGLADRQTALGRGLAVPIFLKAQDTPRR